MSKKDVVEKEGIVKESLPSAMFKIIFDDGTEALATVSGKMRMFHIKILPGDKVKVEFSPVDLTRGRITYRS
ncbi:translation initiation factor IF-1 [candidate division WWE3 bacterium RIFCSPHIGHO2_01_FULL_40_23]|uniref:Translation initiation factor IF-1 n=1 Tax=candidate division WWE3 bacterium RIFCSPLOWO2_01_FULL_41_18 TaxID=1802625 RepID=A0A1F4VD16_UNCKA|nr:MAG: translation initiation factor IF-1 [candidate division WWE3 bacterium RIFCSPHIGHO2_01_FULL_40_23]OGC55146.1 MAG: translation initiation factor IF-1 [candidate division WWE3 bacterium RIFCSPLOWO2_01_FULL_41_18]